MIWMKMLSIVAQMVTVLRRAPRCVSRILRLPTSGRLLWFAIQNLDSKLKVKCFSRNDAFVSSEFDFTNIMLNDHPRNPVAQLWMRIRSSSVIESGGKFQKSTWYKLFGCLSFTLELVAHIHSSGMFRSLAINHRDAGANFASVLSFLIAFSPLSH